MARHSRKTKKKVTGRRRRVSGIKGIDTTGIALAIAGALVAHKLQSFLAKDPTKTALVNVSPFVGIGAGLVLPMFIKNPTVKALAVGMTAYGGLSVLKKLAPGLVGNIPMIPMISGTSNQFRKSLPPVSVNGIGFPLPNTSVYKDSMSVISGMNYGAADGSGGAYAGY